MLDEEPPMKTTITSSYHTKRRNKIGRGDVHGGATHRFRESAEGVKLEDTLLGVADDVAVPHVVDHLEGIGRKGTRVLHAE